MHTQTNITRRFIPLIMAIIMVINLLPLNVISVAEDAPITYSITVTDSENNPIVGATVSYTVAVDEIELENDKEAETDSSGIAMIDLSDYESDLTEGKNLTLSYKITADNYVIKTDKAEISNSGSMSLDVVLESEAPTTEQVTVTVIKIGNGTVKVNDSEEATASVDKDSDVHVEITPDDNHCISSVTIGDEEQTIDDVYSFTTSFTANDDITIDVTFEAEYTASVQINTEEGGTVTLNEDETTSLTVVEGSSVSLSITANEGYQIASVTINGEEENITDVHNFSVSLAVDEDTAISVVFVKEYKVTVEYFGNGEVSTTPEGSSEGGEVTVTAAENGTVTITATPEENYRVSQVVINDGEPEIFTKNEHDKDNPYIYKIENLSDNYNIEIIFAPEVFAVKAAEGNEDTVSAEPDLVEYNGSSTVTISLPNENGYTKNIKSISANGIPVEEFEQLDDTTVQITIENITADQVIAAEYEDIPVIEDDLGDVVDIDTDSAIRSDEAAGGVHVYAKGDTITISSDFGISINEITEGAAQFKETSIIISEDVEITSIYLYYENKWHVINLEAPIKIVFDEIAPVPELTLDLKPNANNYYNADQDEITVEISAVEEEEHYSGIASVKYYIGTSEEPYPDGFVSLYTYAEGGDIIQSFTDQVTIRTEEYNRDDVVVYLTVTDIAGNESKTSVMFHIDLTKPTVSLSFDNNSDNNGNTYFNTAREATVVITESHFNEKKATEDIVITAVNAEKKDVSDAYTISWSHDGDKHTATISFTADANYTLDISYTDDAGNKNEEITLAAGTVAPYKFTVDTTAPTAKIEYENNIWDTIIEALTFGVFKRIPEPIEVTEAIDETSPVTIWYYKSNGEAVLSVSNLSDLYLDGQFKDEPFIVDSNEKFVIYARVTDYAGNTTYVGTNGIIYDATAAAIDLYVPESNDNGIYTDDVTIRASVNDLINQDSVSSGISTISYTVTAVFPGIGEVKTTNNKIIYSFIEDETVFDPENPTYEELVKEKDVDITILAKDNSSDNVVVTVEVTDNAGNTYSVDTEPLNINIDQPEAVIELTNTAAKANAHDGYYTSVSANVILTDRNDSFNEADATAGISVTAINSNSSKIKLVAGRDYVIGEWVYSAVDGKDVHTATITFNTDGNYTIDFEYENLADRTVKAETRTFTRDETNPFGSITIGKNTWNTILECITFGIYSNSSVKVTAAADDETSPVTIEYYKTDFTSALTCTELNKLTFDTFKVFSVSADELFTVYLKITDYAGNYIYISSDGHIVDTAESTVDILPEAPNENGIYTGDVTVQINVAEKKAETYSGIRSIEYWVENNGEETQRQTLYKFDYQRDEGINSNSGHLTITDWATGKEVVTKLDGFVPTHDLLCSEWTGSITVDAELNSSTEVVIHVKTIDNAGNVFKTETECININIDQPEAVIELADTTANDNAHDGYFTSASANVILTDRKDSFNAADATAGITVTAVDSGKKDIELVAGRDYAIGEWVSSVVDGKDVHTAKITFNTDGNYTVGFKYKNKADMTAKAEDKKFTIDNLDPFGTVTIGESTWDRPLESIAFGLYSNKTVKINATADDDISPVTIEYYKTDSVTALKDTQLEELTFEAFESFSVNTDEQFTLYLKLIDYAGNYIYISTDGYILDTAASTVEITPEAPNENGIYTDDVSVQINVTENEIYSGIQSIEYWVECDGKETQRQRLYNFDYQRDEGVNSNGGHLTITDWATGEEVLTEFDGIIPTHDQLCSQWIGSITVDSELNNSTDVVVYVKTVDNAGNICETKTVRPLNINMDQPEAVIELVDDVTKDYHHDSYFVSVAANVILTDRNDSFNAADATAGISITAVNSSNSRTDLVAGTDYVIGEWVTSVVDGRDVHTAKIIFNTDGNYTIGFEYENLADRTVKAETKTFTRDDTDPFGSITIAENTWDKILEFITFGLYSNSTVEVTAAADDETSPVTIEYYKTDSTTALTAAQLDKLTFELFEPFSVSADEQFTIYIKIIDYAGNYIYISSDGFIVDTAASEIILIPDAPNKNNIYNKDVNVQIQITEAEPYSGIQLIEYWVENGETETQRQTLYDFDYQRDSGINGNGGRLIITDWSTGESVVTELDGAVPTQDQLCSEWTGSITVDSGLNNSTGVKVYVRTVDNAGNISIAEIKLDIDVTAPTIQLSFDNNRDNNGNTYFNADRTATVVITERTNHFDKTAATAGIVITAVNAAGRAVSNAYTISDWVTVENAVPDTAVHTATIHFAADANYTFDISYTDMADNENHGIILTEGTVAPFDFTVDTTAPTGTVTATSAEGRTTSWNRLLPDLTFGFWSRESIVITATYDDATSAPVASVEYYKATARSAYDNATVLTAAELNEITGWTSFTRLTVNKDEQFVVYIRITDLAGNYTYISTDGLIVDETAPREEMIAPEITVTPEQPVNGIYNRNVRVDIRVTDPLTGGTYSGLNTVQYRVLNMGTETQSGTLYSFNIQDPAQNELRQTWTGSITVDSARNNSNDVVIEIYAEDNSGNSSRDTASVKIDTTAPTIEITYNNNDVDYDKYFSENRTATIVVTERNFDPDDVKVNIETVGGTVPTLSDWTRTAGTGNGDDTHWTATLTYSTDGDYTFDIAYTDLAANPCTVINYPNSTAPTEFTIDKTRPVISVTYDNDMSKNTNYYKENRTATITITEHNFNTADITVLITATDDGTQIAAPTVSGWTTVGDIHTATVLYSTDALYTFDIEYTDMAGNKAADFAQQTFYVDKTPPTITISGVTDHSANRGEVIPVVSYSDTNFDADTVVITLTGANHGVIDKLEGSYANTHNGQTFTFENFAREQSVDDIYTLKVSLTDKAGNSSEEEIVFSVNRFGSTYIMSDETDEINGKYIQTPRDVVITEINADELKNITITLFKNNETIILTEGVDYRIDIPDRNGGWYEYIYTIFAANFSDDGTYRLSIHSEDAAGNVAENTQDTKDLEISFGVDKAAPVLVVTNLESGMTYALENLSVIMSVSDNLVLSSVVVYLDDYDNAYKTWNEEDIKSGNSEFIFDISGDSTDAHRVRIICADAAGNETIEEITNFYVTTNLWVRYYNNKVLFFGSIGGVIMIAAAAVVFVVLKRRKIEMGQA